MNYNSFLCWTANGEGVQVTALLWGVIGQCGIKNVRVSEWFLWLVSGMTFSGKIFTRSRSSRVIKAQLICVCRFVWLCVYVCDFRKSHVCRPNFDDSSSADECYSANIRQPLTTSDGHKAKVVRRSRKLREQRALSLNCKQLSVAVQTESSSILMTVATQRQQLACDGRLVSTGTQTDDVIVISVSQQLHASSGVPDGLFKSSHSGLLPAIRTSDAHSLGDDRDTDSGHMSDTESKLLTAADCGDKELEKDSVVGQSLSVVSVRRNSEEMYGAAVIQDGPQSAEFFRNDIGQLNKSATMQNTVTADVSRKLSSAERGALSRWTTATRLDILDENDEERISTHTGTFFAPLNDVDVSGISVLSSHGESHLPSSSSELLLVNNEAKSSASDLHSDVIVSSSSNQTQSSAGTHHVSKHSSRLSPHSSSGSMSRPSAGTHRRISKGLRQSGGKPRLSVGRKSLTKHHAATIRDKCHPPTKISRPAAWLMNATKASRSKVLYCCVSSFSQLHGNVLPQHLLTENGH